MVSRKRPLATTAALFAAWLCGCTGDLSLTVLAPDVEPGLSERDVVLAGSAPLSTLGTCVDLTAGERLLDVSAEGDAWISGPLGLRVIEADGAERPAMMLRGGEAEWAVGYTASDALVGVGGSIFRVEGGSALPIDLPAELGSPRAACGDPLSHASFALVTESGLYARASGLWYRWQIDGSPMIPHAGLAEQSGACAGVEQMLFLAQNDDVVAISEDGESARFVDLLGASEELARQGALVAAVSSGELRIRLGVDQPVEHVHLDLGAPRAVSVGAGQVWALAGAALIRRERDGSFVQLEADPGVTAIHADEVGGAWLEHGEGRLCYRHSGPGLRVRGLRPHESIEGPRSLEISGSADATSLVVRVDGEVVSEQGSPIAGTWALDALDLGAPGWHQLELVALGAGGELRRTVDAHVIDSTPPSFEEDIRPLFETHCAGCHADGAGQVPLASIDAWRAQGRRMLTRMARAEMPPPPLPSVPASDIDTLQRWLEGGMLP